MFSGLNDSVLSAFAEPFIYKGAAGDVQLQAVFDDVIQSEAIGGIGFGDRLHTLQLQQSVVVANTIELHKTVSVRGVYYQIIDIQGDVSGMATLTVRRY